MSAYIIVDVEVTDPETYQGYTKLVPATVKAYGGKFVVRGGKAENLEGDWIPNRVVVLEFESRTSARLPSSSAGSAASRRRAGTIYHGSASAL